MMNVAQRQTGFIVVVVVFVSLPVCFSFLVVSFFNAVCIFTSHYCGCFFFFFFFFFFLSGQTSNG